MTEDTAPDSPAPFRLRTLGDLVLDQRGERIGEARRKPLAVLAYVAVAAAHAPAVNREGLAALLWADSAPEKARRTLAQTLYALRKECGADLLVGHSQLETVPTMLSVDATEFREAVRRGDHERALALYGGPFLDGVHFPGAVEFDQWVEKTRAQFAAAHREVLLASARALSAEGETARALTRLEQAHVEYPDDAMVLEALVVAYLANDTPHRARVVIDRFERHLREEYDVPLPMSLQRLRTQLAPQVSFRGAEPPATIVSTSAPLRAPSPTSSPTLSSATAWYSPEGAPAAAPTERPSSPRRWRRVAGAVVGLGLIMAGGGAWYARHVASRPSDLFEARRFERFARRNARLGPLDSSTIGRVALLPPVNRTGKATHDAVLFELNAVMRQGLSQSYAEAVAPSVVARVAAELGLQRHTPATPQQLAVLFDRTGTSLAIQPQLFSVGDSVRVRFTFSRHTAHTPRAIPNGVNVEQYEEAQLDGVEADGHRAAWETLGPLQQFVQSLETCVRPADAAPPSAPWCWTKGRHLQLATDKPSRLRTWWWELQTVLYLTRPPETLMDQLRRERALAQAARRRAIDSSHMGRTVVLPSRNLTGNPALDSLTGQLDYRVHNVLRQSFAQGVPASFSTPLFNAQRNSRLPTTTSQQVAHVLRGARAGLAIQPLISLADSGLFRVHFVFYRDLSHTERATAGATNLESLTGPSTSGVAADAMTAIGAAERRLIRFVRSLELCTAAAHTDDASAPWCWGEGRRLRVADATPRLRRSAQLSAR